jgi:hypothetical protein
LYVAIYPVLRTVSLHNGYLVSIFLINE